MGSPPIPPFGLRHRGHLSQLLGVGHNRSTPHARVGPKVPPQLAQGRWSDSANMMSMHSWLALSLCARVGALRAWLEGLRARMPPLPPSLASHACAINRFTFQSWNPPYKDLEGPTTGIQA